MKNNDDRTSKVLEHKKQSVKDNSESNIFSKSLTVIPEDDSKDLHITGFKIGIDDEEYYFTFQKARSKSENFLGNSTSRNEVLYGTSSSDNKDPDLPFKSKSLSQCITSNDVNVSFSTGGSDTDGQPACIIKNNQNKVETHQKHSEDSPNVQLKSTTKLLSTGTQTEKEIPSSCVQTTTEDDSSLRHRYKTSTPRDIRAKTYGKKTESTKTETDQSLQIQTLAQIAGEILIGIAQMENLAIISAERKQNASTLISAVDVATSTDFDLDAVDKERISDKSAATEDLMHDPLCLAKAETVEVQNDKDDGKNCHCFQEYKKKKDFPCNTGWCHKMCTDKIPVNQCLCHNLDDQSSSRRIHGCISCTCPSKRNCDYIDKRNYIIKEDNLAQNCFNNSMIANSGRTDKNKIEKIKPQKVMMLDSLDFDSLNIQGKVRVQSHLEIAKNLKPEFEKAQFFVAVKLFQSLDVEKVGVLQIPVTITHFLKSFCLKGSGSSKVVVNPVEIDVNGTPDKLDGQKKRVKATEEKDTTNKSVNKSEQSVLLISDERAKKSILVSCILPSVSVPDNVHPRICLCSECYSSVHRVFHNEQGEFLQKDQKEAREKLKSYNDQFLTTSPMIRHKYFDYSTKEAWKPYDRKNDKFECRETSAADIIDIIESSSEESLERDGSMWFSNACEIVNDHLLDLRPVDDDKLQKAAKILHKRWFEVAGTESSNVQEVKMHIQYFEEFSFNLLKTLLHSVDNNGNNVLHFAFANNRFDLVEELLKQSGFTSELLNKRNKIGNSPLLICSISQPKSKQDWSIIRKCFEIGDVDLKSSKSGQTPLMNAASCGFHTMVEVLLDIGANPNLQDKDGSTALMYAAEHGHENCVKALMSHKKCDPTIKDKDAETACSIALNNGHKNIAVLIHMQALEKRRMLKSSNTTRRHVWTNHNAAVRRKSLAMVATCDSWNSHDNQSY